MASITIKDKALTVAEAKNLIQGNESRVNALWETKNVILYAFSKFLSLNGLIPVFFDYGVAASADRKIQAQIKPVNEALANLVKATEARVNPKAVNSTGGVLSKLGTALDLFINNTVKADTDAAQDKAEHKALRKLSDASFALFAQSVDMSKATKDAAFGSRDAFRRAMLLLAVENRGSLSKNHLQQPTSNMIAKSVINYYAATTSLKTLNDPKSKSLEVASKVSGLSKSQLRSGILAKQAEKKPAIIDKLDAQLEAAAKKTEISKEEISARVEEKRADVKKIEGEIKTLESEQKKLKRSDDKAHRALGRSAESFAKKFNDYVNENQAITKKMVLNFIVRDQMPRINGLSPRRQDTLNTLWTAAVEKNQAAGKAQAELDKANTTAKIAQKKAALKDLKEEIKHRRDNNYAGIKREIAQQRREHANLIRQNLSIFSGSEG